MIVRHERGKITWIDVESPTPEELDAVMREFSIDGRIRDEIVEPTPYPLFIPFPSYLFTVLHFPTADPNGGSKEQEVDFIVGKDFILTIRYEVIPCLHNLHKVFEAEELLGFGRGEVHTPALLERIFRRLYGALGQEIEQIAVRLSEAERKIFSGKEREMVREISEIGRVLLRFQTALTRHREPLSVLLEELASPEFFGKAFREHGPHVEAERAHVAMLVESYRSAVETMRATNDSLLTTRQNEIMKVLTIMAFVTFPLTLVSSVFGMNTDYLPIVGIPGDFWIVTGGMLLLACSFFLFFRFRKWL